MKEQTCCITGHRKLPKDKEEQIKQELKSVLKELILQGVKYFGIGGALGFDTISALAVNILQAEFPQIKLILVLPCKNQTNCWDPIDVAIYKWIFNKADKIVYVSQDYTLGCMQKRNYHLVDNSTYCICYLTKNFGGTFQTVNYARKKGLKIINIAENL